MVDINSKYDHMYKNGMVYVLICINNHIITSINFMLSLRIYSFDGNMPSIFPFYQRNN